MISFHSRRTPNPKPAIVAYSPICTEFVPDETGEYKEENYPASAPLPESKKYDIHKLMEANVPLRYVNTKFIRGNVEGFVENLENMTDEQFDGSTSEGDSK